jgi:integrase
MAKRAVTLMWYCKTDNGWRRFPVLLSSNGKVRTGIVMVDGQERKYPEGRFQIRTFENRRKVYVNTDEGGSPTDALAERNKLALRLAARHSAAEAGTQIVETPGRVAIRTAAGKYIQRAKDAGAAEAAIVYGKALEHFLAAMDGAGVRFVDEVDEAAMLRFQGWLRQHGNGPRTIANKVAAVRGFLMWAGVDKKRLGRKPIAEKKLPVAYGRDEMSTLLGANRDRYFGVVLDVLRMAGLREQEAVHLQWADIDLSTKSLHVRSKPEHGFMVKDREERSIPLPDELVKVLRQWKKERPNTVWVLGTAGDQPNRKWLRSLKRLAKRAGLNCGQCEGCRERGECRHWTLHSFRRSYATSLARAGVDVHAIRDLLGHSDLQTTLRYLASMKTEAKRAAVNSVSW